MDLIVDLVINSILLAQPTFKQIMWQDKCKSIAK